MTGQRYSRGAEAFWRRIHELDWIRTGRDRSWAAIARDVDVDGRRLVRWVKLGLEPPATVVWRLSQLVGASGDELLALLSEGVQVAASGDQATARELSRQTHIPRSEPAHAA